VILALSALYWGISVLYFSGLQSPFALAIAILPLTIIYLNVLKVPEAVPINLLYFAYVFILIVQAFVPYLDIYSSTATIGAGAAPPLYLAVFAIIFVLFSSPLVLAAAFLLQRKTRDMFRGTVQTVELPPAVS
jgi:hypothetical protein